MNFTASSASSNLIFFDDFSGTSLSTEWTVIFRHGEYAQNETECNALEQVAVANGLLTLTTAVGPYRLISASRSINAVRRLCSARRPSTASGPEPPKTSVARHARSFVRSELLASAGSVASLVIIDIVMS